MKTAIISPFALLQEYANRGDDYHLVLNSFVMSNPAYADFYRWKSEQGHHVILDNSAHENGHGDSIDSLIDGIAIIDPREVVLPDRLFFGVDTLEMSRDAYRRLKDVRGMIEHDYGKTFTFMAVPQGRTPYEWLKCLIGLVTIDQSRGVDTIGISKDYEVWEGGLPGLVEIVHSISPRVAIHLLGWGRDLSQLQDLVQQDLARGIDSAKPLAYAQHGIRLPNDPKQQGSPPYPRRNEFFQVTELNSSTADHNIRVFQTLARSEKSIPAINQRLPIRFEPPVPVFEDARA